MQTIIVSLIIGTALFYLGAKFYASLRGKRNCGCGSASSCGLTQSTKRKKDV